MRQSTLEQMGTKVEAESHETMPTQCLLAFSHLKLTRDKYCSEGTDVDQKTKSKNPDYSEVFRISCRCLRVLTFQPDCCCLIIY